MPYGSNRAAECTFTVVSAKPKEFPGFLALTVDYREYFFSRRENTWRNHFKREGKFTDKEVLTSRLIDRGLAVASRYLF